MQKKLDFLYESKSNIGWTHGLSTCIGALICAYLTMMIFSSVQNGDNVYKIIPSIVFTPILMSIYGLVFLFSDNLISVIKRFLFIFSGLLISLIISIKVF